mgnify:CR=1 FL=1|jgi:hypothetical protein
MADIRLTAEVDMAKVDEAIQKAERLSELLKEAKSLIDDLASMELKLDVKL